MLIARNKVFAAALVGLALTGFARAADPTLSGVRLGPPISGPKVDMADLKGKVVFLEMWGIH
jgi:hypothetical protein